MKHNKQITIIILVMFLVVQFVGLYVVDSYSNQRVVDGKIVHFENSKSLPYGMEVPDSKTETDYQNNLVSILVSFIFAILIIFFLTKIKSRRVMKIWLFVVTVVAMGITLTSFLPIFKYASLVALVIAIPIAILKFYSRDFISHNLSEILVYPGIAAIFVPLLDITSVIILLLIISLYDAWAVWKSKIMQKMVKHQMEELRIFAGFFVPYASKRTKAKIKKLKQKGKDLSKSRLKINVAALGGGDIVFTIIPSGVVLKTWGVLPSIIVMLGGFLGLSLLLVFSKKKFYPAMPFISSGIFLGMGISWLFF